MKQKKKMHLSKEFNQYICQIDNSQLNIYRHSLFSIKVNTYIQQSIRTMTMQWVYPLNWKF